jgi:hypothetical protein
VDTIEMRQLLEVVGLILTFGAAQVATLRWVLGRMTEVENRAHEREEKIKGQMLTREEFLSHMALYEKSTAGVQEELHRLNGRIDSLIFLERRRVEPGDRHGD